MMPTEDDLVCPKEESSSLLGCWPLRMSPLDDVLVEELQAEESGSRDYQENSRRRLTERPLSLHAWSWSMIRKIVGSRTKFAFYVKSCIRGCSEVPFADISTALFPTLCPVMVCGVVALGGLASRGGEERL